VITAQTYLERLLLDQADYPSHRPLPAASVTPYSPSPNNNSGYAASSSRDRCVVVIPDGLEASARQWSPCSRASTRRRAGSSGSWRPRSRYTAEDGPRRCRRPTSRRRAAASRAARARSSGGYPLRWRARRGCRTGARGATRRRQGRA
jgi:hypothetical protein